MTIGTDKPPQSWKGVRLGNVCKVVNGSGFKTSYQGYDSLPIPFIKVSDMNIAGNEKIVSRAANTVNTNMLKELKAKTCPAGSVIFPKVGGAVFTNKKRLLGTEAAFDNNIMGVVPLGVSSEWLFYWFQTVDLSTLANISALPSIKTSVIKDLEILIPSLPEQQRIAGILNQQMAYVEKARQAAEEILDAAQALPGAFLRQAFPYNLSRDQVGTSNTDNRYFPMVPLGEVAELIRGITFRKSDQLERATEDSLPIATTKAAQESGIIEDALYHIPRSLLKDERKLLRPGDILISTANSLRLVGRTTHVQDINRPISFGAFMTVIRSNAKILDTYLIHCLRTEFAYDFFSRNATTTTNISNLNFRKLATLRIPLPPLCEQQRIADLLNQQMAYVETVRMSAREQLDAINALPAALLRRAFAGGL